MHADRTGRCPGGPSDADDGGDPVELNWLELWAVGKLDLGLTDEEFWGLTLVELNALCTTRRQLTKRDDLRAARICLTIAQTNGNKDVDLDTFMPKTDAEIRAERQARFLAWVDKAVAQSAADEGAR